MSNPLNNQSTATEKRRMLPFFVEFVKFSAVFAFIIAAALFTLKAASAAMR